MRKIIAQVCICFLVVGLNSISNFYPTIKNISKKKICEINTESILAFDRMKKITAHLSKEEKAALLNIKEIQIELCNN